MSIIISTPICNWQINFEHFYQEKKKSPSSTLKKTANHCFLFFHFQLQHMCNFYILLCWWWVCYILRTNFLHSLNLRLFNSPLLFFSSKPSKKKYCCFCTRRFLWYAVEVVSHPVSEWNEPIAYKILEREKCFSFQHWQRCLRALKKLQQPSASFLRKRSPNDMVESGCYFHPLN